MNLLAAPLLTVSLIAAMIGKAAGAGAAAACAAA